MIAAYPELFDILNLIFGGSLTVPLFYKVLDVINIVNRKMNLRFKNDQKMKFQNYRSKQIRPILQSLILSIFLHKQTDLSN